MRTYSRLSKSFRSSEEHMIAMIVAMRANRWLTIIGEDVTLSRTYRGGAYR